MEQPLACIISESLRREAEAILTPDEYPEVRVIFIPSHCSGPAIDWETFQDIIPEQPGSFHHIFLFGCPCLQITGEKPASLAHLEFLYAEDSFSFLINPALTRSLIRDGCYLLIPGQLALWREYFSRGRNNLEAARAFFHEAHKKLVLLDTFTDPDSSRHLQEFSAWIGLPAEIIPVGLDGIRLALTGPVLHWRAAQERRQAKTALSEARAQSAEYATALELTGNLTGILNEEKIKNRIFETFTLLFSPSRMHFATFRDGTILRHWSYPDNLAPPPDLMGCEGDYDLLGTDGFRLKIRYQQDVLGVIEAAGIAFPAYRDRYLNLALSLAKVCGLALSNAAMYEKLERTTVDLREEVLHRQHLEEELRIINADLEHRVEVRTAELAEANRDLVGEVARRKEAEERVTAELKEKVILLREVHHRVKNNLQIIMSLLSLQSRKVPDASLKMAFSESQNRIKVMSYVHEKLFTNGDLGQVPLDGYFRFLVNSLFSLYNVSPESIGLRIETHDVAVDINTAIPLGLIMNELVSNSIRHVFSSRGSGELVITVQEDETGSLHLVVRDNGPGLLQGFCWDDVDTLGLRLVQGLVGQLDGTIVPEYNNGQQYTIDITRKPGDARKTRGTFNMVES
jgi:two-component sensor histidine kinase